MTDTHLVVGRVGRERIVKDNAPPDEGLKERTQAQWQASIVVIDPTHHADGQKITMQVREEIGKCVSVLQSLVSHLNTDPHGPFLIEAFGVVDPNTFWDFVAANAGDVVSVTFEAVPPNMFGTKTTFANELRELKKNEKAEKVKIELRNEAGLNPDTHRMREAVEYTLVQSGGAIKARTGKKKTYSSRNKTRRERIAEPPSPEKAAEHLVQHLRNSVGLAADK